MSVYPTTRFFAPILPENVNMLKMKYCFSHGRGTLIEIPESVDDDGNGFDGVVNNFILQNRIIMCSVWWDITMFASGVCRRGLNLKYFELLVISYINITK